MTKYRDRLEIIADILRAAGSGAKKTRIMYVANLSYGLFEKYLGRTVQVGFLRLNDEGYEVTKKGETFLEKYFAFSSRYSQVERDRQSVLLEREVLETMCQPTGRSRCRNGAGKRS